MDDNGQKQQAPRPARTALEALRRLPGTIRQMSREEILDIGVKAGIYNPDGSLTERFLIPPGEAGSSRGQK